MFYIVYETTNLVNGKKYRGYHSTENLEDGYMGSGTAIMKAFDKYGHENFKREILEFCDSIEHALEREAFYVDEEWLNREDTYNLVKGGRYLVLSEEAKEKISKTQKEKYRDGELKVFGIFKGEKRIPWNKDLKTGPNSKLSESLKGKPSSTKGKKTEKPAWNAGKKTGQLSKEHREAIGKSISEKLKKEGHHNKGKKIPWSDETRQKYKGPVNKGIPAPKYTCPYCSREVGGKSNYQRWHGDNCKQKKL
jgi:hypothetical protein